MAHMNVYIIYSQLISRIPCLNEENKTTFLNPIVNQYVLRDTSEVLHISCLNNEFTWISGPRGKADASSLSAILPSMQYPPGW